MQDIFERLRQYEPFFDIWWLKDEKPLGEGHSGVVVAINDGNVDAALKVIALPKDEKQLNTLYETYGSMEYVNAVVDQEYQFAVQEIEIMRKLKGLSNIVCFEDSKIFSRNDVHGWDIVIRMERLIQLTDDFMRRMKREQILKMWSDLVTGLFYCERNGIVHLDIKPDNIFYTGSNMNLYKLGDFGVSIRAENGKVKEGVMQGSPAYMSPEIYYGQGGDIRSDIYSLGLVIYELFNNNTLPFMAKGGSREELEAAIRRRINPGQEIPPLKSLDGRLSKILMRCLRYDPNQRYQTVRELHEELQQYMLNPKPKSNNLLKLLIGVGALGTVGAILFFLLTQSSPRGALTFVGPSGVVDTGSRTIMINGQTGSTSELKLRGSARSQVVFQIVDRRTGGVRVERPYVLDENGEQTVWSYGTEALEDGTYGFVAWYADQTSSQETFSAIVDTVAPQTPEIVYDLPYAGAEEWPLTVSAEPGSTVYLLADGVEADVHKVDEGGVTAFTRTYESGTRYTLVSKDAVGNDSEVVSFYAVEKEILAELSEVDEDDDTLTIRAETGSSLALSVNGTPVDASLLRHVEGTEYAYQPAAGFVAGDSYALTVTDSYGLQATTERVVAESTRQKIAFTVVNLDEQGVAQQQDLELVGTAESGDVVWLTWNGSRVGGEIPVLDGEFRGYLSMEDAGVTAEGATGQVAVVYQFGAASRGSDPVSVKWQPGAEERTETVDYRAIDIMAIPELELNADSAWVITGQTDASTEIGLFNGARGQAVEYELTRDGEAADAGVATMSSTSGAATLDIGLPGLEDGAYRLTIRYQDAPQAGEWQQDFIVDRTPPALALDGAMPYADVDWRMAVMSEPGALLSMRDASGTEVWTGEADENGAASFSYVFEADADYSLVAEDGYGNVSAPLRVRAEEKTVLASIYDIYEDSEALMLDVDADADSFTIYRNGEPLDREALTELDRAEGYITYGWQPPEGKFDKGDAYTLEVTDVYGLTSFDEKAVQEADWAQIGLTVENVFEPDEVVYDSALKLRLTGQPNASVELLWNGVAVGERTPGEDAVETELSLAEAGLSEEGGSGVLSARYASGYAESMSFSGVEVTWTPDDSVRLDVEPLREDSEAMVVETDADATVEIARIVDGAETEPAVFEAVEDGRVTWTPEGGRFYKDEVYVVRAVDHIGNARETTLTVTESTRQPLALAVDNPFDWAANGVEPFFGDVITVTEPVLRVSGTGEPGQRLNLYWKDAPAAEAVVGDDGSFSCAIEERGDEDYSEAGALSVEYADGRTPSLVDSLDIVWFPDDGVALNDENGALQLYWGGTLTVYTDPDAMVDVIFNGQTIEVGRADETGRLDWYPAFDYAIGDAYIVRVTDVFGHTRQTEQMRVEEIQRAEIRAQFENLTESSDGALGLTDTTLALNGTAEPGAALEIDINGAKLSLDAAADGTFSTAVMAGDGISSGDIINVTVAYADGASASRTLSMEPIVWDWDVDYVIDGPVTEDSQSLTLSASEPVTATLYYRAANSEDWTALDTLEADGNQDAAWPLNDMSHAWTRGDQGRIVVEDRWGNADGEEFTVGRTALADIECEIETSGGTLDGLSAVTEDALTVSGSAEPGQTVEVSLYAETGVTLAAEAVEADAQGRFAVRFEAEALGSGYDDKTVYYAGAGYPWEVARVYAFTPAVRWDFVGPDVSIDNEGTVDVSWRTIQGRTEPGATVVLSIDDAALETTAEDGAFEFKRSDLLRLMDDIFGKTMRVMAYDEAGNPGEPWEITFEKTSYPGGLTITNQEADGSVSGKLRIEGWFAGFDRLDAQVILLSNDGKQLGSARPNYRDMTDDEKALYLGDLAASYGSYCYAFDAEYDLANVPAGDCRLVLMHSDFISEEQVTEIPVTVVKSAADSNTLVVETDVAIDVDAVTRRWPSDGIVMTGWIYQSENAADTSVINGVQIDSVSGAVDRISIDFEFDDDKSDDPLTVLNGKGYAFVDRDISTLGYAVRSGVTGVSAPTNRKAGFVLNLGALGQTLPDGEYTLTINAYGGEDYKQLDIGPVRFTVDNGASKLSTGELDDLLTEWRPIVVAEEPEAEEAQPEN